MIEWIGWFIFDSGSGRMVAAFDNCLDAILYSDKANEGIDDPDKYSVSKPNPVKITYTYQDQIKGD